MKYFVLALGIIVCLASVAVAAEAEPKAEADTEVNESEPNTNYGAWEFLEIWGGQTVPHTPAEQGLVYFDENIFAELRAANQVIDVSLLKLYVTNLIQSGEVKTFRVAGPWDEMTVTWNTRPDSNLDMVSMSVLPPGQDIWFQTEVTDMVRSWVEATFPVHGFYVTIPEQGNSVGCQFASINHLDSTIHPRLFIEYHDAAVQEDSDTRPDIHLTSITTSTIEINLSLPSSIHASIKIYDASGMLVETLMDGWMKMGDHRLTWDGTPGIYFVRLEAGGFRLSRKAVILK